MRWPTLTTYDRQDPDGNFIDDFNKSYLGIRFLIGFLGLALPLTLVVVDAAFLDGKAEVRGSMSAYYHSPARDLFVGGLWATGVVLVSYLWWKFKTWDFSLSLVAGIAVLSVATFPTGRPDVDASGTSCATVTAPPCAAIQETLGEGAVEVAHKTAAAFVVVSFAALCLVFALREFGYGKAAHRLAPGRLGVRNVWKLLRRHPSRRKEFARTYLYLGCMAGVLLGAIWCLLGPHWLAPPVYMGELMAFSSFGAAWIVASWDLFPRRRQDATEDPSTPKASDTTV
ncbi:hypothetical protein [Nocardioides pyridinolyticus]